MRHKIIMRRRSERILEFDDERINHIVDETIARGENFSEKYLKEISR